MTVASGPPLDPGDEGFSDPRTQVSATGVEAPGNPLVGNIQDDYFGFESRDRYTFPDGVTYIEFEVMNEGKKKDYQQRTNRPIEIARGGGAKVSMDIANERWVLIKTVVTSWNLSKRGQHGMVEVPFNQHALEQWLNFANPRHVEELQLAIQRANPWLSGDMTSEQIQEEIDRLRELYKTTLAEEERKAASSSR